MNSTAVLPSPARTRAQDFPYKRARDVWARFTRGEISLGHAMHDIKNNHTGILHATKNDAAERARLLEEFLPADAGAGLFYEIRAAILAEDESDRKKNPGANISYIAISNVVETAVICLKPGDRAPAYETVRDMNLRQSRCMFETRMEQNDVHPFSAASGIVHAAKILFPDEEQGKNITRQDLRMLFDLAIERAERFRHDAKVLQQSLFAAELYINTYHMAGLSNEHIRVSAKPIESRGISRYSVALMQSFNGNNLGPAMIINGRCNYLNGQWEDLSRDTGAGAAEARGFVLEVDAAGRHPKPLILHPAPRRDIDEPA